MTKLSKKLGNFPGEETDNKRVNHKKTRWSVAQLLEQYIKLDLSNLEINQIVNSSSFC